MPLTPRLEDPIEVTVDRAKKLYYMLWGALIWCLLVSGGAGISVWKMYNRLEDSCDARQTSRTAYRLILSRDEDWDQQDQELLDANLPATVSC